ncbi:hypothetical protein BH11PSE13_BH11PSE13_11370 [soil metagenome]
MPITVKVNGVANSLVHKGSNGISTATIPDVCKTPSPGGPVPIPYPNISQSITLDKGTTTVKADGGMMIATKGSEFSLSNGDNAGVAGGVKSSTFMKESTWILYSFDVKMDGSNACRLSDKKFQNHENTVDLGGTLQVPVLPDGPPEIKIACAIYCCDKKEYSQKLRKNKSRDCARLGSKKHGCVNQALKKNADPAITPSPRFKKPPAKLQVPAADLKKFEIKTAVPDVMFKKDGKYYLVDAKFPCSKETTADQNKALGQTTKPDRIMLKGQVFPSAPTTVCGSATTDKEKSLYPKCKVDGQKVEPKVHAVTPSEAAMFGEPCDCKYDNV